MSKKRDFFANVCLSLAGLALTASLVMLGFDQTTLSKAEISTNHTQILAHKDLHDEVVSIIAHQLVVAGAQAGLGTQSAQDLATEVVARPDFDAQFGTTILRLEQHVQTGNKGDFTVDISAPVAAVVAAHATDNAAVAELARDRATVALTPAGALPDMSALLMWSHRLWALIMLGAALLLALGIGLADDVVAARTLGGWLFGSGVIFGLVVAFIPAATTALYGPWGEVPATALRLHHAILYAAAAIWALAGGALWAVGVAIQRAHRRAGKPAPAS